MGQRRFHYEQAFEALLRRRRLPYVCVDEARKALLPGPPVQTDHCRDAPGSVETGSVRSEREASALKSFDFVVYDGDRSLLVDVKGRKVVARRGRAHRTEVASVRRTGSIEAAPMRAGRMESWVTEDDVRSLGQWKSLFGPGYEALFVFVYWCDAQPPDGLYQEIFEHRGRWYAVRAVELEAYRIRMTQRSPRWRTVHLSTKDFESVSQPFREMIGRIETDPV